MQYFHARVVILISVIATAISTTELNAQVLRPKEVEYDYFAIKLAELTATFDPTQVVSEEPLPNHAWYQMDSGARVVVPSSCEAYVESPAAALQIEIKEQSISADLSVIPLIMGSSYRWISELIGNARLKSDLTPKHREVLIGSAMALDTNSPLLASVRGLMSERENVNLLSWIDEAVVWHLDFDQEWADRQSGNSPWGFNQEHLMADLPLGVFFPSRDNLRMAAFVIAIRATIERIAPNILTWNEAEHLGKRFAIGTFASATPVGPGKLLPRIYYATLPDGFAASTNERVMKRMIEHHSALAGDVAKPVEVERPAGEAMLPPQQTLWMSGKGANLEAIRGWNEGMRRMRRIAWTNIPALNYLRHEYPDQDPIVLYERIFGEAIMEPAGGTYEWNEKRQTYESSNYGHHLAPRAGPAVSIPLSPTDVVATALSFQDGGVRAQLKLDRKR